MNRQNVIEQIVSLQPKDAQRIYAQLRALIKALVPQAEEKLVNHNPSFRFCDSYINVSFCESYVKLGFARDVFLPQDRKSLIKSGYHLGKVTLQIGNGRDLPVDVLRAIIPRLCAQQQAAHKSASDELDFGDATGVTISPDDQSFLRALDEGFRKLGYASDGIQPYVCWGKYVVSYYRPGLKTKKYVSRIYLRDDGILFRMYFSNVDAHMEAVMSAPDYIRAAFTREYGRCTRCRGDKLGVNGTCLHRKSYTLFGTRYDMCDGQVFLFDERTLSAVDAYLSLLCAFYPAPRH